MYGAGYLRCANILKGNPAMANQQYKQNLELDRFLDDALSEAMRPVELTSARRDDLRDRVLDRARSVPPVGTRTIRSHEGHWRQIMPLVHQKILRRDTGKGTETALYRMEPDAVFPPHFHTHEEECMVLEGEIEAEGHIIRAGDVHIASAGCEHPSFTSRTGALLLIRSQISDHPT